MQASPPDPAAQPARRARNGLVAGLRPVLGLLVSALFLWLSFRRVQFEALLDLAYAWPVVPIALGLLFQVAAFVLRLVRWGLVNRHLGDIGWRRLLSIGSVGLSAVFLLPVRLGEVVRPALVGVESDVDFSRGSAAVVLERVVDGWIMSMTLFATLFALGDRTRAAALRVGATGFAGGFLVASVLLAVAVSQRSRVVRLAAGLLGRLSARLGAWLARLLGQFLEAFGRLGERAILPRFVLLSLAMWLAEAASIYVLFGVLEGRTSWLAALTVLCALVLGTTLPSGPALLGVFEYAVILSLGLFGIDRSAATAYGLLLHTLETVTVLGFGLAGIWAGGLRLRRVLKLANEAQARASEMIGL